MRFQGTIPLLCALLAGSAPSVHAQMTSSLEWPALQKENRPWTRWWWMGSAVSEAEITRHLELFQKAGIGGVEISPIYGVEGENARYISYLSPRWVELLGHTLREAKRLNMGVDMITGTGWPLGGPWVEKRDAPQRIIFENPAPGAAIKTKEKSAKLLALWAYSGDGQVQEITDKVAADGRLDWAAPAGDWKLRAAFIAGTNQQVKRAAPGGEGNVLDHYAAPAVSRYLNHFDGALAPLKDENKNEKLRCFFNDSFEVFGANWCSEILPEFEKRRGYDLNKYLPALAGLGDAETVRRVRCDYRETIGEMLLENFTVQWSQWANKNGSRSRNQAHGSPGNWLDLYAAADVPETEAFGDEWLAATNTKPLPGNRELPFHKDLLLACKMASSAAHVANKPLCSSESFTWLGEHAQTPLAHAKAEADLLFTLGINHIFFHGSTFSPADAGWPGWMFYASTHFAPTNTFWHDLPVLNDYMARCQALLQQGQADNDVLMYLPIYELWSGSVSKEPFQPMTMHNADEWIGKGMKGFAQTAHAMRERGYSFDFVSDKQLRELTEVSDGAIKTRGAQYRTILVAGSTLMPPQTLERLVQLAQEGATVCVVGELPKDVPGLADLPARRARLQASLKTIGEAKNFKGKFIVGNDVDELLRAAKVERETMADWGLRFMRRRVGDERVYFVLNQSDKRVDEWINLSSPAQSVALLDAVSGQAGIAPIKTKNGATQVRLQLEPKGTIFIRALPKKISGAAWNYAVPAAPGHELNGPWRVEFFEGGPTLPAAQETTTLQSWTHWSEELKAFSGTARYSLNFARPQEKADAWQLDLGDVAHSARVKLNGREIGKVVAPPFRVTVPVAALQEQNQLEIEVTNLMANRLADLERRGVKWRKFLFVNIDYKTFDAAQWPPLPSGLLGPVRLVPLKFEK